MRGVIVVFVSEGVLSCEIAGCPYSTASKYDLRKHVLFHSKTKNYVCSTCQKPFTTSSDLKRHERTHTPIYPNTCSICGKGFDHPGALENHMTKHTGQPGDPSFTGA